MKEFARTLCRVSAESRGIWTEYRGRIAEGPGRCCSRTTASRRYIETSKRLGLIVELATAGERGGNRESLKAAIVERFGPEKRFYTCSAQGMDADQIIRFLEAKGKFRPVDDGFNTDPDKICNH